MTWPRFYEVPSIVTLQPNIALIDAEKWTYSPVRLHITSPSPQVALLEVQLNHIRNDQDQELPGSHTLTLNMGGTTVSAEIEARRMITLPIFLEAGVQTMVMDWHETQGISPGAYIVSLDRIHLLTQAIPYTTQPAANDMLLVYGNGWYAPEAWDASGDAWRWAKSPAALWVYSPTPRQVLLETKVGAVYDAAAANGLGNAGNFAVKVNNGDPLHLAGHMDQPFIVAVEVQAGWNEVVFELEAGNFRPIDVTPGNGDLRELSFALRAFVVSSANDEG
ncbi:MAG: hypothetical protein IPM39_13925 [Chloroflexi bacterium]|nr:hypothetical protein [Chloroflexota bacterium]